MSVQLICCCCCLVKNTFQTHLKQKYISAVSVPSTVLFQKYLGLVIICFITIRTPDLVKMKTELFLKYQKFWTN